MRKPRKSIGFIEESNQTGIYQTFISVDETLLTNVKVDER